MKSSSLLVFSTILAAASAIPVEGVEGGIVIQGGNADTRLGMFYKPIKSVLETAAEKEEGPADSGSEVNSNEPGDTEAAQKPNPGTFIEETPPENLVQEETIVILDSPPTPSELIMSGLLNMLVPQQISPPSPIEEALSAVEEALHRSRNTEFRNENKVDIIEVDFAAKAPSPPSEMPDLLSMLEPMIEPSFPRMNAGETMMIGII